MNRLFFVCASLTLLMVAPSSPASDQVYRGTGHMMVTPDQLRWQPVPSTGEGAEIAFIEGDLSRSEAFTFRLRMQDGYRILPHTHPAYERLTVLKGTLHFAHGREFDREATSALTEGSVAIMPPGHPMFGFADGETIIQLHGSGPWAIEYVDPDDDPRNR